MLFRGEMIDFCNEDDARREAKQIVSYFSDLDAEDEEAFQAELIEA